MERETDTQRTKRENEGIQKMEEYYSRIFPSYKEIIEALKEPLPCTFRVTPGPWSSILKEELKNYKLIQEVPWGEGIYKIDLSRKDLSTRGIKGNAKALDVDELQKTHLFLKNHSGTSAITRQEAVSMLPVFALDVQPDSSVLDMCASPGSKSSQILEILSEEGTLICNDINSRRVAQLVKQTKRFMHPGLVITCNDATVYPRCGITPDRVLCDVPCSGDGTIRKNRHIFQKWGIKEFIGLFQVQKRILKRGLDMLSSDGILVYSTCSLNPVENEMVLLSVLEERPDVEIVPFEVEGLIMHPGLEESKIIAALEYADIELKIQRCKYREDIKNARRILPMDQNTGGFFIAKLKKKTKTNAILEQKKEANSTNLIRGEKNIDESYFYWVDQERRKIIEEQWGKSGLSFISKTLHFKNVYGITNKSLEVLVRSPENLRIVFAGCRLFSVFGREDKEKIENNRWRITYEGIRNHKIKTEKVLEVTSLRLLGILTDRVDEEIQKKYKKGIFVLSASDENIEVAVPFTFNKSEIEVLVEKDQKEALIDALKIKMFHRSKETGKTEEEESKENTQSVKVTSS
ncbi:tRNA (cytosine34-C5)-methyltransferase [Nematocida minor]|uniref:tRNA (cytosine34-C5)-methyltransferase n=1 Tax=Nematocida minor TaxID=1912983 RepID=UPI002221018D|nr:tRNA (cytosine34-C5)-methyltransferase [Nematocida minor]KAI5189463.1 tRNA (cytosine34-C5)-methyltransferase [Nematocida minor]